MKEQILEQIKAAKTILISSHIGADGDSAGSAMGLMRALDALGKESFYINDSPISHNLLSLPGFERLAKPLPEGMEYDLGIVLDCSSESRVGEPWPLFEKLDRIVIDHHEGNGNAADIAWIDQRAAAVTIMIAELLEGLGVELTFDIAYPLYVGLLTDTGSFQQSNTDARAMRWGANFIEAGVRPMDVCQTIFEERRIQAVVLSGRASSRAEIRNGIAFSSIYRSDYDEVGAIDSDVEGVIHNLRSIGDVRVTVLFREQNGDEATKVTFRSKDETDVAAVAAHFGGGGHRAASGCTVQKPIADVREEVLSHISTLLEKN